MNKQRKIIISIVGIAIVLLALLGITYAYYLTRIQGNTNTNSISVTTAKLELTYGDGNGILLPYGTIEPNSDESIKFYKTDASGNPITNESPVDHKTFTVTNNGNDSSYVVIIDNVSITKVSDGSSTNFVSNDFRYTLTCKKSDNTDCNNVSDLTLFPIKGGILVSNDIKAEDIHTYTLTMWYIDTGVDQSDDMGKTYQARVNITDVNQLENPFNTGTSVTNSKNLAYSIINNAKLNKNGTKFVNAPLTVPAESSSDYVANIDEVLIDDNVISSLINTSYQIYYWTYAYEYEIDRDTGKFSLIDPKTCKYDVSDCLSDLVNNDKPIYLVSFNPYSNTYPNERLVPSTNLSNLYLLVEAPPISDSEVIMKLKKVSSIPYSVERILSLAHDNYGISYYFRGSVEDNYVNFAEMCWRIVRIEGNESIKLILEDQDEVCSTTMNGNWDIEASDGSNITMDGSEPYRVGNFGYDDSTGKNKMSYLNPVNDSNIAMINAFKYFQTNTLKNKISNTYSGKSLSDYLISGNWCLNNKTYSNTTGTTILEIPTYTSSFYYDSYVRLYGNAQKKPTLKCPVETIETFGDNTTPMYVGSLTADEIVYAGGKAHESNPNYYLINNWQATNSKHFWSLSPFNFGGSSDRIFYVNSVGSLFYDRVFNVNFAFRPSVTLLSGTVITGGEGTLESPYVIG